MRRFTCRFTLSLAKIFRPSPSVPRKQDQPNSIPKTTLEQITARAEAIKLKIEPSTVLLNVPACVDFIENGVSTLVAVAFLVKEKSNLVLMNLSNEKEIYLKDCHVLKRNNSFAIHNQKDNEAMP